MVDLLERKPDLVGAEMPPDLRVESVEALPGSAAESEGDQARVEVPPVEKAIDPSHRDGRGEAPPIPAAETPSHVPQQDPVITAIEGAMASKRLAGVYAALPEEQQAAFRASGEALARELRALIGTPQFKYLRVWQGIRKWLHSLPGKDRSFLEQESNIVYNRVARMHEEQRNSSVAM
ncbi:MAG: hypothetical protein NUV56_03060 [Candidatus Uhrbacteria bacterium]|nr:hypothetical protein [Candidatus Uhrbacteria bacterium]